MGECCSSRWEAVSKLTKKDGTILIGDNKNTLQVNEGLRCVRLGSHSFSLDEVQSYDLLEDVSAGLGYSIPYWGVNNNLCSKCQDEKQEQAKKQYEEEREQQRKDAARRVELIKAMSEDDRKLFGRYYND